MYPDRAMVFHHRKFLSGNDGISAEISSRTKVNVKVIRNFVSEYVRYKI